MGALIQGKWKTEINEVGEIWMKIPGGHSVFLGDMEGTDSCCFAVFNLIEAAPDLLDVCEEMIEWSSETGVGYASPFWNKLVQIEDALVKARGGKYERHYPTS